jgi:hypothetical protein
METVSPAEGQARVVNGTASGARGISSSCWPLRTVKGGEELRNVLRYVVKGVDAPISGTMAFGGKIYKILH